MARLKGNPRAGYHLTDDNGNPLSEPQPTPEQAFTAAKPKKAPAKKASTKKSK